MAKSSVKKAIAALQKEKGKQWEYNSKTRGAINKETGEKISRRQLDKNYGLLKAQGVTSYEGKAKQRKKAGLTGFKSPAAFPNMAERTFFDRQEMLDYLATLKDGNYVFRVKISGEKAGDRYKIGEDGLYHCFADALAFMQPSDLLDTYDESKERALVNVVAWTLVARKEFS